MNAVDLIVIAFVLGLALWGYGHGLIVGAFSLGGFAAGIALGARLGPELLDGGASSPYAPAATLASGLVLGGIFALGLESLGHGLRARLVRGRAGEVIDGLGGSVLLAALALALAWVVGAVVLNAPGLKSVRADVQRSAVLSALNDALPPSGALLNVLNRIDPRPEVEGPDAKVRAPEERILGDPDVEGAAASVVRVRGEACGLGVEGSGWVAGPGLIVTNAHVVAGHEDTTVSTADGAELDATAVHYDPSNDLAVLSVPGLSVPALELAGEPKAGTAGAIIGYPNGGELAFAAARLGGEGEVISQDSYGNGPIRRLMTPFRGEVQNGNSGGPVVDRDGAVITTVFASRRGGGPTAGLGVPNSIVADALAGSEAEVSTGPCAA